MFILRIWFDAGSDFNGITDTLGQQSGTFDIAQVQIEPGPVATPFERRPIGTELALCQRYYETVITQVLGTVAAASENVGGSFNFREVKRATPTLVEVNLTESALVGAVALENITTSGFRYRTVSSGAGAVVRSSVVTASAEL
jgi:hypothetical protein